MGGSLPTDAAGKPLNLDFEAGTLEDWKAEGEAFAGPPVEGDAVAKRRADMKSGHQGGSGSAPSRTRAATPARGR